ncbi:MAG: glycosyltransferase family 4 protein [Ignavibacteriaceae bacterium]|jgi:glycosyltransferase involved in cell wall biosynthesis
MFILEIARSFYPSVGGLEKFLSDRFRMYDALNIKYDLIATDFNTGKFDKSKTKSNVRFVKQFTPYNFTPSIHTYLSNKYDLISVNQIGRFFSDYAIRWAKNNGVKTVLTPHFTFHTNKNKLIKSIIEKTIVKNGLNFSDAIVCFTEVEKNYWVKLNPTIEGRTHVIPHSFMPKKVNQEDIVDDKYLLYLGRFEKNKRIDLLLQAFEQAKYDDLKLKLTIDVNDLPKELKHFKENKDIFFLGYVDEIEKESLLKKCSALILPSDFEAFGIVLLEASNYYKPILCSNLEVFNEVVDPKGAIKFSNNVDEVTRALNKFQRLTLTQKREMGEINFHNLQRFDIKTIYPKYETLFKQMS